MAVLAAATAIEISTVAITATAILGVLGWTRRRLSRRFAPNQLRAARPEDRAGDCDELRRFEVEMHELARQISAEVDTKIAVLRRLIASAESQADRLEALVSMDRSEPCKSSSPTAGVGK